MGQGLLRVVYLAVFNRQTRAESVPISAGFWENHVKNVRKKIMEDGTYFRH